MHIAIVLLYAGSAVLPVLGLYRILYRAKADARKLKAAPHRGDGVSIGQLSTINAMMVRDVLSHPLAIWWDFALVGGGLVAGAAASIWSYLATIS